MASKQKTTAITTAPPSFNRWYSSIIWHVPFSQKMMVFHHLQVMIGAGLPIVSGLKVLSEEIENKGLRLIVGEIKKEVEKGKQLSEAILKYPKIFPVIYASMIAAGESAGQLEEALRNVYEQMYKSHELSSKVRNAMIYPAVIVTAMVGVAIEVVFFVLPNVISMFEDFGADLPIATRILIGITKFGQNYGIFVIIGFIAMIILYKFLMRRADFKTVIHKLLLKIPIFGPIIKKINLASFTMTLSSLLQSAVPIIEAVRTTAEVQTNVTYKLAIMETVNELRTGVPLSSILRRYPKLFPPTITEMVLVGEESGQLEKMLQEMAKHYTTEVDDTMNNFSKIIEPVIILFLGLGVAGVAVAVIMPMYSLAQSF